MELLHITQADPRFPQSLTTYLGDHAPASIAVLGDLGILDTKPLALFCSVKCPGKLILQTYDLAQHLRHVGATVIGGFHSPMERECLAVLLKGAQPVIICPARGIQDMRIAPELREAFEQQRLLILSPFADRERRPTVEMALRRNLFVAALASGIFVAYAEPAGKTEQFCREVVGWGKPLYTLEDDANANLIALGARAVNPYRLRDGAVGLDG